jgi:hypothetical protein
LCNIARGANVSNLYDVTTITVRPNTQQKALAVLKDQLANARGLVACWFTDIGALNRIMIIRAVDDLAANLSEHRALLVSRNPFGIGDLIDEMTMDIYSAFDCVAPVAPGDMGPFYEVRTYMFRPDGVAPTEQLWREWLPKRAKVSPILTAMMSATGQVARFMHIWPYKSLDERARLRAKAVANKVWPPPGGPEQFVSMQNDIYMPAPFSPLR